MQMIMTDLLSRLSALTGPSRELDAEIALANGWQKNFSGHMWMDPQGHLQHEPPRYTESIDAAMTLVPKEWFWNIGKTSTGFCVELWDSSVYRDRSISPAIALVIACLKAKEDSKP